MNASNRNLLAVAMATVLLSPAAWAQRGHGPPDMPRVEPMQTSPTPNSPEQTMRDMHKPVMDATGQQNTMPPPAPPQSQGAEHAAANSSIVQRDLWTRLDTDGDGKISPTEAAADTAFNAGFAAMDTNQDGYVSDTEYRAAAKSEMDKGRSAGGPDTSPPGSANQRDAMHRLDANADGSISTDEAAGDATFKSNFATIDTNSDGMVTRAEYRAWVKANRK